MFCCLCHERLLDAASGQQGSSLFPGWRFYIIKPPLFDEVLYKAAFSIIDYFLKPRPLILLS
jgi:hypothetical protein